MIYRFYHCYRYIFCTYGNKSEQNIILRFFWFSKKNICNFNNLRRRHVQVQDNIFFVQYKGVKSLSIQSIDRTFTKSALFFIQFEFIVHGNFCFIKRITITRSSNVKKNSMHTKHRLLWPFCLILPQGLQNFVSRLSNKAVSNRVITHVCHVCQRVFPITSTNFV